MTEILIKRLSKDVKLPKYETDGSSGMDLSAYIKKEIKQKNEIQPTAQLNHSYLGDNKVEVKLM